MNETYTDRLHRRPRNKLPVAEPPAAPTRVTVPQRVRPPKGEIAADSYDISGRPPAERLPAPVLAVLAERDRVLAELHQLQRDGEPLRDRARDTEAEAADQQESADLVRLGQPFKQVTDRRDQLARDRQANRDQAEACQRALRDLENGTIAEAAQEFRATPEHEAALTASRDKAVAALARASEAAHEYLQAEALDMWLRGPGQSYAPADRVFVAAVAPEITSRGVARDVAGVVRLSEIFDRLHRIIETNQEEM